jgi:phosphohistidine phosphatase
MKTLFLVRHAKSSRDDPAMPDRERPLNDRGREDAPEMGKRLARHDAKPQRIVSSPALRALTTAQLIAGEIGHAPAHIVQDERLYAASVARVLGVIHALDDGIDRVMLVGHNPEFTELAHRLSGEIVEMPTCAVAEFRFDTKAWSAVGELAPCAVALETPKK